MLPVLLLLACDPGPSGPGDASAPTEPPDPPAEPIDIEAKREATGPPPRPQPDDPASPCPPGMAYIPGGEYTTGMKPPVPYGVVDTTRMAVVDHPERQCPDAIAATEGASACWVQTDLHDPVVLEHAVTVEGYCIERLPFPGAGPYSEDGMTTWDAERFDELLTSGEFGPRRLCGYTEYELAVAGPEGNLRYVYGDTPAPERCPEDEQEGIGARPGCSNPETGLMDYGAVISQWVLLDDPLVKWACEETDNCRASGGARLDERHPDGRYAVRYIIAGGTRRVQTRQAPYTPHTFHDHGQVTGEGGCDTWGWDDGPAVCATPDPRYATCRATPDAEGCAQLKAWEDAWAELTAYCRGRRMTACLNRGLSAAKGEPVNVCRESTGALGPGQGR
jgi:hypothetical protein